MKNPDPFLTLCQPGVLCLNRDFATGETQYRKVRLVRDGEIIFDLCNRRGVPTGAIRRLPTGCMPMENAECRYPKPGVVEIWMEFGDSAAIEYRFGEAMWEVEV